MFKLGERVIYPGHGAATIARIITKKIGPKEASFYQLKFVHKEMTVLVPTESYRTLGIRNLSSDKKINDVLVFLSEPGEKKISRDAITMNWKQRNKDYQSKLRTGDLTEISEIYRDLKRIEQKKELSFCEKTLLSETESLLVQEIALVKDRGEEEALEQIRSIFLKTAPLYSKTSQRQL